VTPEAKVKAAVRRILDKHDAYYFFPPGMGLGRAGVPDIIICHRGYFIAVECKATPKEKPTALQLRELSLIREAEGFAIVIHCDNLADLDDLLEKIGRNAEVT
jgi:hypothetical protein